MYMRMFMINTFYNIPVGYNKKWGYLLLLQPCVFATLLNCLSAKMIDVNFFRFIWYFATYTHYSVGYKLDLDSHDVCDSPSCSLFLLSS